MNERSFTHLVGKTFREVGFAPAMTRRIGDNEGYIPLEVPLEVVEEQVHDRGYRLVEVGQGQQMGQVSRMFLIRDTRDENNLDISVYEIEGKIWVDNIDYGHFIRKMIER